jgi:hypothetical protein
VLVDDPKGPVTWSVECGSPSVLVRDGWRPKQLKPGDKISLSIHPRKDETSGGYYADELPLFINGEALTGKTPNGDARATTEPQ